MQKTSPMARSALFVADLERSSKFYRDVLGLEEVWFAGEFSNGNAHQLLGMPAGSITRARILKAPGPAWGMVGLFEVGNPAPPKRGGDTSRVNQGETCMVFYNTDLDKIQAYLEAGDHHILCAPLVVEVDGKAVHREMTFRDPDGVLISLIEKPADDLSWPQETT